MIKFQDLGLIAPILKALDDQGYTIPSPIQTGAIPPALEGRDVLGCAQTGTGKTCAFAAPILQRLNSSPAQGRPIRALILTPTRELALQIQESFEAYGKGLTLRSAVIFGGVGQGPQVEKLKRGVDILVATPGRLLDLQEQGLLSLGRVEILVLDEADRMLDMGFIHDVRRVLKLLPEKKQTLFFSATMPPEVTSLVNSLLHNPARVMVDPVSSPVEIIDQSVYLVDRGNKSKLLANLIDHLPVKNALVFARTKHGANKVAADLIKSGIAAAAIHGNKSQMARQQALADFKAGKIRVLVATDIAARGLDIEELSHVVNYNLPEVPETYIHRIGRTGRAGREGTAVSFCDFGEKPLLAEIEKLLGRKITRIENHPWPMAVFEAAAKDSRGREVNPEDAEARAAAKARKMERLAKTKPEIPGKKERSVKKAAPAPAASAPVHEPRQGVARGRRLKQLEDTLPANPQQPADDFARPNPLDGDKIMDATARLLAPRPRVPAPAAPKAPTPKVGRRVQETSPKNALPKKSEPTKQAAPLSEKRESVKKAPSSPGRHDPRRRQTPRDSYPSSAKQKDSTEQPSLMKPYYIKHD
ncbi:ATP-dependent RNA helicase RhlE [bioreactor metagenome]|uniref:ATP-dependent RNA helicase RhlE n=1 Tax=bioreactor metagenome TaxID=1076179 RepID=A0A644X193_9ZZZZ